MSLDRQRAGHTSAVSSPAGNTAAAFSAMRADMTDLQTHVDNGFAEVRGRFDATAAGQQHIVELLTTIIDQPGSR